MGRYAVTAGDRGPKDARTSQNRFRVTSKPTIRPSNRIDERDRPPVRRESDRNQASPEIAVGLTSFYRPQQTVARGINHSQAE